MRRYSPDQEDQYDAGFGKTYNPVDASPCGTDPSIKGCTGCAFRNSGTGCLNAPACNAEERLDGRDIIWVAA